MRMLTLLLLLSSCAISRQEPIATRHLYRVTFVAAELPYYTQTRILYSDEQLAAFKQEIQDEGIPFRRLIIEQEN